MALVDVLATNRGTKTIVKLPVTQDLGGLNVDVDVHVLAGSSPGPTLSLLSTLHGSEWLSVEMFRRLLAAIDVNRLSGTLLAVPVGNPVSLCYQTRCVPDESDAPDVNRAFGNQHNWLGDQLARVIGEGVITKSTAMIDWHPMPWGCAMDSAMYPVDLPDPALVEKSKGMAMALGAGAVQLGRVFTDPGPKSSFGYAALRNIPSIAAEVGGIGWGYEMEEEWIGRGVRGMINVMRYLGMLEGEPELPERTLLFEKRFRIDPRFGGLLIPERPLDRLMRRVEAGEVLAKVVSANTFEELEVLTCPGEGYMYAMARFYAVRPGDWSYLIADAGDENTVWV